MSGRMYETRSRRRPSSAPCGRERHGAGLAGLLLLLAAGCTPAPRPAARPVAAPPPVPTVVPPRPGEADWRDVPLTPGTWSYASDAGGTVARYGTPAAAVLTIRCDLAQHVVTFLRTDGAATAMTLRTSYGSRGLPAGAASGGGTVAAVAPRDPLLDQIAFSRGRFSVAAAGMPTLFLPAWAEPARVFEDCRG